MVDVVVPAIGEALRYLQMSGVFYSPSELSEPWGLELPPMENCVWFHVVTAGETTIDVHGETRLLRTGDLALVPHGAGHRAWGREQVEARPVLDLPHDYVTEQYGVLRHGGGGSQTRLVCGGVRFDHPGARHLIEALPPLIHVEAAQSTRSDWLQATLALIAEETQSVQPGSDAVVSRLCDIVVIQAIRAWLEHDPAARTGWLGALHDAQIGRAIAKVHAEPGRTWTVASLADEAAISRSGFAARFTELVGESAMSYVTRWRMHVAADLLQSRDTTVAAVAHEVGYDSEAAFGRAYKRVMGVSPGSVRAMAA